MGNNAILVSAIDAYYRDRNLYQFHEDVLNDPRADLSDTQLENHKVSAAKHKDNAQHMLGYIKMLFLKDLENAPQSMKDVWYGTDN